MKRESRLERTQNIFEQHSSIYMLPSTDMMPRWGNAHILSRWDNKCGLTMSIEFELGFYLCLRFGFLWILDFEIYLKFDI